MLHLFLESNLQRIWLLQLALICDGSLVYLAVSQIHCPSFHRLKHSVAKQTVIAYLFIKPLFSSYSITFQLFFWAIQERFPLTLPVVTVSLVASSFIAVGSLTDRWFAQQVFENTFQGGSRRSYPSLTEWLTVRPLTSNHFCNVETTSLRYEWSPEFYRSLCDRKKLSDSGVRNFINGNISPNAHRLPVYKSTILFFSLRILKSFFAGNMSLLQ